MDLGLKDRVAIVTGGNRGIGYAISTELLKEGAHVVVCDLIRAPIWAPDGDRPTDDLIREAGGSAVYERTDIRKTEDVTRLLQCAVERTGRLDILVNSAATFGAKAILDTTEDAWDTLMSVNLRAQFVLCKHAIGQMITQPEIEGVRGRIINLSSQHGMVGPPEYCAYAVSKAGVAQLTRQLAVDYAKHGIIVNAVAPGRIMTGTHEGEREYLQDGVVDADTAYSLSRTPFPRLGRPEDVAGAALFLASDDCSFISGHNLLVDGGWMAY